MTVSSIQQFMYFSRHKCIHSRSSFGSLMVFDLMLGSTDGISNAWYWHVLCGHYQEAEHSSHVKLILCICSCTYSTVYSWILWIKQVLTLLSVIIMFIFANKCMQLARQAGLPPGILNVVTASRHNAACVGKELCENPLIKKISFTGSTNVGKVSLMVLFTVTYEIVFKSSSFILKMSL